MRKRTIVKLGTGALTNGQSRLDGSIITGLSDEITRLQDEHDHEFVIVTSGAVATGKAVSGSLDLPSGVAGKQVLAAIGQPLLMAHYVEAFQTNGITCAQILLTRRDFTDRRRSRTLSRVIDEMLKSGVVPILNENDAITTEEVRTMSFADNDQLAALVACLVGAEKLIVLSDVDGFYDGPPSDPSSKVVPVIRNIDDYWAMIDDSAGSGKGGMRSKLETAKTMTQKGISMHIANGKRRMAVTDILAGKAVGTYFPA